MDLNKMTLQEIAGLCAKLAPLTGQSPCTAPVAPAQPQAVVVCTDQRGVVFGYTSDPHARPINLTNARMCLYWSADVGGVFGLADIGPTEDCKISATAPQVTLEGVTAVFAVTDAAVKSWTAAKVQGR